MEPSFRCELLSWTSIYSLSRTLAGKIRQAGFQPDLIVAIARGGYVPARILCDFMDITALTSIRIVHYVAGARKIREAKLVEPLRIDVRGKNVLLVDDVSDTGDTQELALHHIRDAGPKRILSAVLHHKITSPIAPDCYGARIIKWRWIIYPWAVIEDLTGILTRMEQSPATPAEAVQAILDRHNVRVPLSIMEEVYDHLK